MVEDKEENELIQQLIKRLGSRILDEVIKDARTSGFDLTRVSAAQITMYNWLVQMDPNIPSLEGDQTRQAQFRDMLIDQLGRRRLVDLVAKV